MQMIIKVIRKDGDTWEERTGYEKAQERHWEDIKINGWAASLTECVRYV